MIDQHILIIDDESDIRAMLSIALKRMGHETSMAKNAEQAKSLIDTHPFDLILCDMKLPDGDGFELLEYALTKSPETPFVIITAYGSMDLAIQALKQGAFDFLSKPVDLNTLKTLVSSALNREKIQSSEKDDFIIGESEVMLKMKQKIKKLAASMAPIYISGESGSGKELAARALHQQGSRAAQPFIAVNCGAIPKELMESEFFGHRKGSFTGAHTDKNGLFTSANGGTIFLDEIADLPIDMQVKLLRVIQERKVRPVGAETELEIDVRILCATHKKLELEVEAGRFRQDLFYRLNVIELPVPPLRERKDDLKLLTNHFLQRFAKDAGVDTPAVSATAMESLKSHTFPGNIRELENILERAFTLCENNQICEADFGLSNATATQQSIDTITDIDAYLGSVEKKVIISAIKAQKGNRTAAAKRLGITFRSLRYRIERLGITEEDLTK